MRLTRWIAGLATCAAALLCGVAAGDEGAPPSEIFGTLFDTRTDAPGTVRTGILGTRLFLPVLDRVVADLGLLEDDEEVAEQHTEGYLKVGRAWLHAGIVVADEALQFLIPLDTYDIAPLDDREFRNLELERRDALIASDDVDAALAQTGKLRAKALLRAQNHVLFGLIGDGETHGVGFAAYLSIAYSAYDEIVTHRKSAEETVERFHSIYDGPETKHTRKGLSLLGKGIAALRKLEPRPGDLIRDWYAVSDVVLAADELPRGKARTKLLSKARRQAKRHKGGWSKTLDGLFDALVKIEKGEAELEKADIDTPTPEPIPAGFPATVDPGPYYALLLVNNGTGTGYIPNGWEFARVGTGKETVTSREQLWDRMRVIVTEAEQDFAGTFSGLYHGALDFDRRGVPVLGGGFITTDERLALDAEAVAYAVDAPWTFQDVISYPEWKGYLGTRNYRDAGGVTRMRIVVGFIRGDTPPVVTQIRDAFSPGEYRISRALVLGPLVNGEVIVPVRTLHVGEAVDLYDALLAEMASLREGFAAQFVPLVDPKDAAEIQRRQQVLLLCGPPIYVRGIVDPARAPLYLLFTRYVCDPTAQDPFPQAVNLTVGFERIGD